MIITGMRVSLKAGELINNSCKIQFRRSHKRIFNNAERFASNKKFNIRFNNSLKKTIHSDQLRIEENLQL